MEKYNTLGDRIKQIRQDRGISQTELSKKLNCTQAALSQYEKGVREPGLNDLINIANNLNTTTDYLLGITDVWSKDISVKNISDYLGLNEASIEKLHNMYSKYKTRTEEQNIIEEVKSFSGIIPGEKEFINDYQLFETIANQDLCDYKKTINSFICSNSFSVLISSLVKNLYLERTTYDMLKIIEKQYEKIKFPYSKGNYVKQAYSLAEDSEDNIRNYSLNIFDTQTAILNFCQEFTKLEEIKKLEQKEAFFRRMVFSIFSSTCHMFEKKQYSVEEMEKGLSNIKEEPQIKNLIKNYLG